MFEGCSERVMRMVMLARLEAGERGSGVVEIEGLLVAISGDQTVETSYTLPIKVGRLSARASPIGRACAARQKLVD